MSIVRWIHISDLHIRSSGEYLQKYKSDVVLRKLWEDIDRREKINPGLGELDFAFITGDLAWSGADKDSEDEYDEVYKRIISPLKEHTKIPIENIFIVPGNHDISRSKRTPQIEEKERDLTERDRIAELFVDPKFAVNRKEILSRLDNYRDFVASRLPHIQLDLETCTFSTIARFGQNKLPLQIIGLDSAWLSQGGEPDKGSLSLADPMVQGACRPLGDKRLTITLVHHPLKNPSEWYKPFEKDTINQARASTDFLLCGHVHESDVGSKMDARGAIVEIVGGSIYYDRKWESNSYNYVIFDLENNKGNVFLRRYHDSGPKGPEFRQDIESTGGERNGVLPIILNKTVEEFATDQLKLELNEFVAVQTKELDNRPLLSDTYPGRDSVGILFPDVYVDPFVIPRKHPASSPIPLSRWIAESYKYDMKVLVIGKAGTGKTTSLINIHHEYPTLFKSDSTLNSTLIIPFFYEARSHHWSTPLKIDDIVANAKSMGLSEKVARKILSGQMNCIVLIDAIDEAFPKVSQELGSFELSNLILNFPHVASCRSEFFERNLDQVDFTSRYDEILELQPWRLDREVDQFLSNYFSKRSKAGSVTTEDREVMNLLKSAVSNYNFPTTPLSVTLFLFLWLYDRKELEENPITSFTNLLKKFSVLWVKREISGGYSAFREFKDLFEAYEVTAWEIYLNREKGPVDFRRVAKEVSKKIGGVSQDQVVSDRGFLSMLRTKKKDLEGDSERVISFVHEAIYEFMLANKLVNTLQRKDDQQILHFPLGHSVNRFARELMVALPPNLRDELILNLSKMYRSLQNRGPASLYQTIKYLALRFFRRRQETYYEDSERIIMKHNICYFWGRLEAETTGGSIKEVYKEIVFGGLREHPMVTNTIGSGILLTNDVEIERIYLSTLSDNSANDKCNRIYHRVYYGDASYSNPNTFLKDDFTQGKDDWTKTRQAILNRLESSDLRAQALRGLDLITFRRLCETRGVPRLDDMQREIIKGCVDSLDRVGAEKADLIRQEYRKLMKFLDQP